MSCGANIVDAMRQAGITIASTLLALADEVIE
jgi:hypothetical protein